MTQCKRCGKTEGTFYVAEGLCVECKQIDLYERWMEHCDRHITFLKIIAYANIALLVIVLIIGIGIVNSL